MAKRKKAKGAKKKGARLGYILLWFLLVVETLWLGLFVYSDESLVPSAITEWRDNRDLEKEIFSKGSRGPENPDIAP